MAQINDAKKETLANLGYVYTAVDDAYKAYLQTESGLTEGTIQDLEKYLFEFLGYSGNLQSMWFEFLRDNGYTNTLQDMLHAFWNSDSAGLSPLYFSEFYSPLTHTAVPERAAPGTTATFTRATTATVMGYGPTANSGDSQVLLSCASGEARFQGARRISQDVWSDTFADGTPIPLSALKGYLAEGARTNYALWNRDLTNVAWTKTSCTAALTATGADNAANSASTLTATAGNATCLQSITRVSAQRITGCKIKRRTGTGTINMTQDNGATWTPVTVTSAYTNVAIPAATAANPIIGFQIVTNGDAIDVDFVMHEEAAFVSSSIATTTIAVARNADVLTYSSAGNASTSSLWLYNELEPAYLPADLIAVTVDDGSNNNRVLTAESASGGRFSAFITSGGATQYAPLSAGAISTSSSNKVAVTMSAIGAAAAINAELLTTTGAITPPASFTTIRISGRATGDFFWFGTIRNVHIGQRQLSASEMQAITA